MQSKTLKVALITTALAVLPCAAALADGGTSSSPIIDTTIGTVIGSIILWLLGIPN